MCLAPEIEQPEPEEPEEKNELLITDEEEEMSAADARKRGTQGLQIGLKSGGGMAGKAAGGLAI